LPSKGSCTISWPTLRLNTASAPSMVLTASRPRRINEEWYHQFNYTVTELR
jgi:hypothetical protein